MKKVLICLLATFGLTLSSSIVWANVSRVHTNEMSDEEISIYSAASSYRVSCVKYNGNITIRQNGTYDSDAKTLTIDGYTFSVRNNPYYEDGSKKGAYRYMAGDWFFNF